MRSLSFYFPWGPFRSWAFKECWRNRLDLRVNPRQWLIVVSLLGAGNLEIVFLFVDWPLGTAQIRSNAYVPPGLGLGRRHILTVRQRGEVRAVPWGALPAPRASWGWDLPPLVAWVSVGRDRVPVPGVQYRLNARNRDGFSRSRLEGFLEAGPELSECCERANRPR